MKMKPHKLAAIIALVGGRIAGASDGSEVNYGDGQTPPTEAEIDTKLAEMLAEWDAQEYARNRKVEYPPWADQLDHIFHNGIASWKTNVVQPVKDKYPKG